MKRQVSHALIILLALSMLVVAAGALLVLHTLDDELPEMEEEEIDV